MLFMIGIEPATKEGEAHGMVVPVFSQFNYGCNSAADEGKDIVSQATEAILMIAEEVVLDGLDLEALNEGYKDYSQDPEYSLFTRWLAVEVDIEGLKGKPCRFNVSFPDTLLARVDAVVAGNAQYKDRSHLLAVAAQNEISHAR